MAAARSIESLQQANVSHHQDSRSLSTTIEPKHGGFKERFLLKLEEKYKCEYCRHALCNPKQTECGHRFCESCLSEIFRNRNAVCPVDNEPLFEAKVFKDICCKREILSLKIYCRNEKNGCKEQLSLGKLEAHLLECPYQEVRCARRGCTEKVQRKDLADHLNSSCKYREQMCKLCRKEITMAELKKHEETECPSVLVKCPNKCNISVLRSELSGHLLLCPNVVVHCSYSTYGCNFLGTNQELKVHEANSMAQHLNLSMIRNIDNETKVSQLQSELQDKCKIIQSMTVQISNLEKELVKFGQLANKNEGRLGHLQKMMASQTDQLFTINQTSQQTQQKHEEMSREAKVVKESVDGLQTRVRQLEVTSRAGSTAAGQGSQTGLDNQVRRHDSLLSVHDVRLADIDLRFQVLETASYNGRLIWKIREYTRRKQEAVSGKTLSLYSQPFYTGYFGYKMCARVYLNGDGMGKGTHLSLFFVVMRGEYDALLPWPFKQKVTLMLLDQGTGGCHLGDAFKPDPNSSSFKRPQGEMNIASGCPLFVTQTVLESKTYIKDDTIFIKVGVDTSDLPDP